MTNLPEGVKDEPVEATQAEAPKTPDLKPIEQLKEPATKETVAKKPGRVRRLATYIKMKIKNVLRKKPKPVNVLPPKPEKKKDNVFTLRQNLPAKTEPEAPTAEQDLAA